MPLELQQTGDPLATQQTAAPAASRQDLGGDTLAPAGQGPLPTRPRKGAVPDIIFIPPEARQLALADFAVPARLAHVLEANGIRRLGDLQGRLFSGIRLF